MDANRLGSIGIIVTNKDKLIEIFGLDDYQHKLQPRIMRLAREQKAVILDINTDDSHVVDRTIRAIEHSLKKIRKSRLVKAKSNQCESYWFDCVPAGRDCVPAARDCVPAAMDCVPAARDCVPAARDCVPAARDCVPADLDCVPAVRDCVPARDHVSYRDYLSDKDEIDIPTRSGMIRHIQIIGGNEVVPFAIIPNPVAEMFPEEAEEWDLEKEFHTDDVYADLTSDSYIDVPIARIPDGRSLDLLIRQIEGKSVPKQGAFGLANKERTYAGPIMDIFDDEHDIYWSPDYNSDAFSVGDVNVENVYFVLHGDMNDTSVWKGPEVDPDEDLPIAFKVSQAYSQGTILTGVCYGAYINGKTPADSICLRFLRSGAKAFIGCTGSHWSSAYNETTNDGPLFHGIFFEYLMTGMKPSLAFYNAKLDYAIKVDTVTEEQILNEYVFYGRL